MVIANSLISAIGVMFSAWMAYLVQKLNTRSRDTQRTAERTHTLVNGGMAAQLRLTAAALRRVAELTKDPVDAALATEAERAYAEHRRAQAAAGGNSG